MNLDESLRSVRTRFSAASSTYHQRADIQRAVAVRLLQFMPEASEPSCVLEVGCGTGVLTELLVKQFPSARIHAMDISEGMVIQARNRLSRCERVQWSVCDIRQPDRRISYPFIASSSSLHWIFPIDRAWACLAGLLQPGGEIVAAVMAHGTLGELRAARLQVAPHKPPLDRLPTEEEVLRAVEKAGLQVVQSRQETLQGRYESAAAFLRQIHEQGLTGGEVSVAARPLTRGELTRLAAAYEAGYGRGESGVRGSYKVLYLRATKSATE